VPNRVSLSGHTDAAAFGTGDRGFSNWELSAERANTARREMVAGGMADTKVLRVVGLASAVGFPGAPPLDAVNRRISIIVLNRKTEQAITSESAAAPRAGAEAPRPAGQVVAPAVGASASAPVAAITAVQAAPAAPAGR